MRRCMSDTKTLFFAQLVKSVALVELVNKRLRYEMRAEGFAYITQPRILPSRGRVAISAPTLPRRPLLAPYVCLSYTLFYIDRWALC